MWVQISQHTKGKYTWLRYISRFAQLILTISNDNKFNMRRFISCVNSHSIGNKNKVSGIILCYGRKSNLFGAILGGSDICRTKSNSRKYKLPFIMTCRGPHSTRLFSGFHQPYHLPQIGPYTPNLAWGETKDPQLAN